MTPALAGLKPEAVWKHFDALLAIPRASTKEERARQYVLEQAKRLGLEAVSDKVGNIVVRKPARPGRENAPMALLQGHLDMVCEKNEGTDFNFDTDGIRAFRDGDWLRAEGTTLGADNGIGVAAALAVMESTDINHGPLEFVFTIDEETGLTGAAEFPPGLLKAKYFLNLDGEEEGKVCIGCAGGINTIARRTVARRAPKGDTGFRVKVSGLKGGHSGVDIHLGRGNAIRSLGRILQSAMEKLPIEVAELKGGSKRNVIPREAFAIVAAEGKREAELKQAVESVANEIRMDLGGFDPGLEVKVERVDLPASVIDDADAQTVVGLLASLHHGVLAMSPDIPGLVQTSTNLATVSTDGETVEVTGSQRSAIESSKLAAARMVATACRLAGFTVEHTGSYPGWKPEPTSGIVKKMTQVHEQVFGQTPELVAMHAGLECGVIGEKYPGMEMVAFGPQIEFPHSPGERVKVDSVETFWKYLRAVLEAM